MIRARSKARSCTTRRRAAGSEGLRAVLFFFGVALATGCARGGDDRPPGSVDAGPVRRDSGPPDGGGRDSGPPVGCDETGYASTCQAPTVLEPILPGERHESELNLIARGSTQWIQVAFPPAPPETPEGGVPSMAGSGHPSIRFLRNDGDVYRIELRTACVGVASCGQGNDGMATGLTEWSFGDDPAMSLEGQGQFSTRETPWPESVYVRIYPRADPECGRYQLEITR